MKLRSLTVNQFKRFTEPTRLGELNDGLNLVVGPNELGKSTLLDALKAVLFERYSSRAQPIVALQNYRSGAAPVVELVFEVDGAEYTLTKRFVKRAYARLRCPEGTLLEADSAEDKLRDLLGFAEAGIRGANPESLGMWGVLWVQQGQSFGRPNLPNSALKNLSAGLESEVGIVLGGRRGRELPQIIEQQLGELITKSRRQPRGEYKSLIEQIEETEQQLCELQQQHQDMLGTFESLSKAEASLKRLDEVSREQSDQEELGNARDQLTDVIRQASVIGAASSELQSRQIRLDQTRHAYSERASRRTELSEAQARLRQDSERLEKLQQQHLELLGPLSDLRRSVSEAESAAQAAEQSEEKCRQTLDLIARSTELNELLGLQGTAAEAQERLDESQLQAGQIRVTDESLQEIRRAAELANQANARLNVATTRIGFDIPSDRLAGIEAHGEPLADPPKTIEAVEKVEIVIPERGRIVVDPSTSERDQLSSAERVARDELRTALEQAGAQSLAQAEVLRDQRRDLEAAATLARSELDRLIPSGDTLALQNRIDELRQWQLSLPSELQIGELPGRDCAELALRSAQSELGNARHEERAARAALDERASAVAGLSEKLIRSQSGVDLQTGALRLRQEKLCSDAQIITDEELASTVDTAGQAVAEQLQIVSEFEAEWSAGARPRLEARIARLESTTSQRAKQREELRTEVARLKERIESQDSAGIEETIEHTQQEIEQSKRLRERHEREIKALDLLSKTLRDAESEAKDRYLAPVLSKVRPYLQMLFPNADINMDEDLKIVGMSRDAGYEERFDHLSMGTQEQIAVLVRLAFAEMLVDQGAPAAVILDDALVFSDDQRMQLMFDILSHASRRVQILVFTCREQLFEELGAHQLKLGPGDPELLRSA